MESNMWSRTFRLVMIFAGAITPAHAQWLNYPSPKTPLMPNGRPNLLAKTPRAHDGKPDLSGVWQIEPPAPGEIERLYGDPGPGQVVGDEPGSQSKYFFNLFIDFKPGEEPLRPEAVALTAKNRHPG